MADDGGRGGCRCFWSTSDVLASAGTAGCLVWLSAHAQASAARPEDIEAALSHSSEAWKSLEPLEAGWGALCSCGSSAGRLSSRPAAPPRLWPGSQRLPRQQLRGSRTETWPGIARISSCGRVSRCRMRLVVRRCCSAGGLHQRRSCRSLGTSLNVCRLRGFDRMQLRQEGS